VRFVPALVIVLGLAACGCETHVRRGSALYADGRYVEAAEVFERTEYRLPQYSPRERAEYGLYRGMTLLVLGDLPSARHWLSYAYDVERTIPGALRSDRRALLDRGWFELGQRMRVDLERTPLSPDTAVAATQPDSPPSSADPSPSQTSPSQRTLVPR
jgi:tetratricopeptide (TPR) repeat protein